MCHIDPTPGLLFVFFGPYGPAPPSTLLLLSSTPPLMHPSPPDVPGRVGSSSAGTPLNPLLVRSFSLTDHGSCSLELLEPLICLPGVPTSTVITLPTPLRPLYRSPRPPPSATWYSNYC